MFNTKKPITPVMSTEKTNGNGGGNGTTLISAGTTIKGDISSNSDLRIDGTIIGNINSNAKIVIGSSGVVEGDIFGNNADIVGKTSGTIKVKELLQLRGVGWKGQHLRHRVEIRVCAIGGRRAVLRLNFDRHFLGKRGQ